MSQVCSGIVVPTSTTAAEGARCLGLAELYSAVVTGELNGVMDC